MDEFNLAFDNETPSKTNNNCWFGELKSARSSLQNQFREGCSKSIVKPQNIDVVQDLIMKNLKTILHDSLALKIIC